MFLVFTWRALRFGPILILIQGFETCILIHFYVHRCFPSISSNIIDCVSQTNLIAVMLDGIATPYALMACGPKAGSTMLCHVRLSSCAWCKFPQDIRWMCTVDWAPDRSSISSFLGSAVTLVTTCHGTENLTESGPQQSQCGDLSSLLASASTSKTSKFHPMFWDGASVANSLGAQATQRTSEERSQGTPPSPPMEGDAALNRNKSTTQDEGPPSKRASLLPLRGTPPLNSGSSTTGYERTLPLRGTPPTYSAQSDTRV